MILYESFFCISTWKALIVAYRDALKHYQRAMAAEAEEKGEKGDN